MHEPMVITSHTLESRINSALWLANTKLILTPLSWWQSSCGLFSVQDPSWGMALGEGTLSAKRGQAKGGPAPGLLRETLPPVPHQPEPPAGH